MSKTSLMRRGSGVFPSLSLNPLMNHSFSSLNTASQAINDNILSSNFSTAYTTTDPYLFAQKNKHKIYP